MPSAVHRQCTASGWGDCCGVSGGAICCVVIHGAYNADIPVCACTYTCRVATPPHTRNARSSKAALPLPPLPGVLPVVRPGGWTAANLELPL